MRYIHFVVTALFAAAAVVQFNDPDPLLWVLMYGGVAVVSALAAFGRYAMWLILLGLAVSAFEFFLLMPALFAWLSSGAPSIARSMQAETPHIELVREFLGVTLCLAVLIFYYVRARKDQKVLLRREERNNRL